MFYLSDYIQLVSNVLQELFEIAIPFVELQFLAVEYRLSHLQLELW